MILLEFNTFDHTLTCTIDGEIKTFDRVVTIKNHDDYYEILQRQTKTEKNAPLLRVPINSTVIEYSHE